jgi:hypothetical protein
LGAVEEDERDVLVGMTRRGDRVQAQATEVDLVAVAEAAMRVAPVTRGRGEDRRVIAGRELEGAGQEVRV